jgi:hypothetical protein
VRDPNLKWVDWRSTKPEDGCPRTDANWLDAAGCYLVWSPRRGIRLTTQHPSWWNRPGKFPGERVRLWYRLGPMELSMLLAAKLRKQQRSTAQRDSK